MAMNCPLLFLKHKKEGDNNSCRHLLHYNKTKEGKNNNNKSSLPSSLQQKKKALVATLVAFFIIIEIEKKPSRSVVSTSWLLV
jgi:hypothetical protein